jgi:hypothetical protein
VTSSFLLLERPPQITALERVTDVTKDQKTNGLKAAIKNNPRFREAPYRWDRPYNSRCLIKGCESPVYHDGATYFSLCLLHLEELSLGPFFKPHNEKADDYD